MNVTEDLLPCPFCGGEAHYGSTADNYWFVSCADCMASTDQLLIDQRRYTHSEACNLWNRRVRR